MNKRIKEIVGTTLPARDIELAEVSAKYLNIYFN